MNNNYIYKYIIFNVFLSLLFPTILFSQEAIKSIEEDYYSFLALQGLTEHPSLNYRTLSDSAWQVSTDESHPWQKQNLGTWYDLFGNARMRIYGPELFMSGNTAAPYGQNDGVLWQGRGFNALLKGGVRFEGYGIELTLLPHFSFSQNAEFDILPSAYESEYGYFWGYGVDAPQRFGNKPFFNWDFGDSEIRYTWRTLTVGFGTQAVWLGPSYLNSILHSNNAPAYPKIDIGLRRQKIIIPWLNWYIGDFETRLWVGILSESDFFDSDDSNNNTMLHGFTFAYAPSFLSGLTLFINRIALVPWAVENIKYVIPLDNNTFEDQKMSFGFSWELSQAGINIYGELGIDDYIPDYKSHGYIRYPFHTMLYTVGIKKIIPVAEPKKIYGILFFEWNSMEMSQDFQFQWPYSPYFHHQIIHGYTNRGQWLGAGTGWGGNSQYLEFRLYYPKGTSSFFVHRNNPDNNFIYKESIKTSDYIDYQYFKGWKSNLSIGLNSLYYITDIIQFGGGFIYNLIINPLYYHNKTDYYDDIFLHNISLNLSIKLLF